MAAQMKLVVFGDQTFDVHPHMHSLMQHRTNPLVEDFLVKAYNAVRNELYNLPAALRDELPRFTSLDDMLLWKQDGTRAVSLDMAVTCIYQFALFISQASPWQYTADNTRLLGLCTGALTATAVSCSSSLLELIPMAVDVVVVAFRTGMHVTTISQLVEPSVASDSSWSILIPSPASEKIVQRFCEASNLPDTSRPYISAYAPGGITVSGPPSVLTRLKDFGNLKRTTVKSLPIYGPYHAPHLHSLRDIEDIVGSVTRSSHASLSQVPIISSTGEPIQASDFKTLLKVALKQILLEPIRWTGVLEHVKTELRQVRPKEFTAVPIGTKAEQVIYNALKQTPLRSLLESSSDATLPVNGTRESSRSSPATPKLAIIGMSGRFPGARDTETFWEVLHRGLDVHKPVPDLHWSAKTHVDPTETGKNTSATPYGCWLDDPAGFDARFFNISPREAPQMDPAQRLALMTAYEAIEQAGLVPDATPSTRRDRVGVFYGVTSNDWMETNSAQDIDTYFIPGGNRAFIPGRINYYFKFSGPSYAVDTACSSSLAGIHLACNALWRGEIDTAIAGGTNVLTNPDFTAGLDRGHFLSRTGNCKTFDDSADGYCRGEGIGTVIIKRLDDALADADPILGTILGAYTNHSAESSSITRPHAEAQRTVFRKILNQAAVDPYSIGYVEMHGTGTQAGDAGEMSSVLDTFAPPLENGVKGRSDDQALYLGSAKSNIGHGEAASGISSLIKVLLMMQKNTIVPHCGIKGRINRKFPTDLAERKVNIASKPTTWPRSTRSTDPRRVFVNNFSAAGGNTALLIEDCPIRDETAREPLDPRQHHLVAISAKNGISLQGNLKSLLGYVKQNLNLPMGQLSYTTTARRIHHQHRVMLMTTGTEDLCSQLEAALREQIGVTRPKTASKVVFAFTGQGAQYPGMGKDLLEHFSLFRREIRRLDQIGQNLGFPSIMPVIQSEEHDVSAFEPAAIQLASVCLQIALAALLSSWNVLPSAVVGHSLGEYAALHVAGVISAANTIYLVGKRAMLLQEKCTRDTHAMLVVNGSVEEIARVLEAHSFETACVNSPIETVLAGPNEDIATYAKLLNNAGMRTTPLRVPFAFHSSQIEPVLEHFKSAANGVSFNAAKIPVLCPLDGTVIRDGTRIDGEYLARHTREPVNMFQALLTAKEQSIIANQTAMVEVGPHPAVSGMVRAVLGNPPTTLACMHRGRPTFQILAMALKSLYMAGADIKWAQYHADFRNSHEVLPLPAYSWDLKPYWMQYVNDWSLRKGDPPLMINSTASKLDTTTVHRILEESGDSQKAHMVVEADITREDLSPLVQGHEVDGNPLCTPSVYADMALSLGTYLLDRYQPSMPERLLDITDMTISKALILRTGVAEHLLQAHVDVDWSCNAADMKFMTFDKQQKLQEHARCTVHFKDRGLLEKVQSEVSIVKRNMRRLREGIATGDTARFNRPMVYRAIRPLARFHEDYRAIDEFVLDSSTLEAMGRVSFGSVKRGGVFHTHPAIIDALTQSCAFAMNCNDGSDLDNEVFMNHGWQSFQMFEPLDFDKVYTTHTRMSQGQDKLWHGDVVVLEGDRAVAFFGQIAIQGVPRRVLNVILSIESGNASAKSQPNPKLQPPPVEISASVVKAASAAPSMPQQGLMSSVLAIVAEEAGIAQEDLTDDTNIADVGIDSLLSLTICARFREELNLDIDNLYECSLVADLKVLIRQLTTRSNESETTDSDGTTSPRSLTMSEATTALTVDDSISNHAEVDFGRALHIIAEESGMTIEEVTDDTNFADCGVDSLLSLVIVSRLRDELGLDISEETLFMECPTVADLKKHLNGSSDNATDVTTMTSDLDATIAAKIAPRTEAEEAALVARKKAVDYLVEKFTANYIPPTSSLSGDAPRPDESVVLVTGASGSLGGHLVYHLAQLPNVKTVVCLNRDNRVEPFTRQLKAMREKGIRFPEHLKPKLLVYQTDTSMPKLGLTDAEYDGLTATVTHLIHNAWPMSAKRALPGFEPQFQVMRNLIDFGGDVVARRPRSFQFTFQMVSSIGVVGNYGLDNGEGRTMVPEERMTIDAVLPNGYGDAKWGCERMLDETIHKVPGSFRTMAVRLGQIAGSKTSGYWNPMEHFGFLIKSSQTLNALPDVDGKVFWTPVNDIAATLSDLLLMDRQPYPIYHIENPIGQSWKEMNAVLSDALQIRDLIPFDEWVKRVAAAPQRNNPAFTLLDFLDSNYLRLSCGGLVLDVKHTLEHSPSLRAVGPVSEEVVRKYIHVWKEIGFLSKAK